jgi:hypothetical protein
VWKFKFGFRKERGGSIHVSEYALCKVRATNIFQKSRGFLKILGTRRVKWSKCHTEEPQILEAITSNSVPDLCSPGYDGGREWKVTLINPLSYRAIHQLRSWRQRQKKHVLWRFRWKPAHPHCTPPLATVFQVFVPTWIRWSILLQYNSLFETKIS